MSDEREGKIHSDHLEGEIKGSEKSNTAWALEHSLCQIEYTHARNNDGKEFTFFFCQRHQACHLVPGVHRRVPA